MYITKKDLIKVIDEFKTDTYIGIYISDSTLCFLQGEISIRVEPTGTLEKGKYKLIKTITTEEEV